MTRLPDFIVIGAMKCATSTIHEQLARQPGVFMSTPKEPNFFSDDEQWNRGLEWYGSLFKGAAPSALCGESSTHYTKLPDHPRAVERARRILPDSVKLIYIVRHPIDRLVSHYIHEWSERTLSCSIDDAIDLAPRLVDYGCYARQLAPWRDAFGQESILPVFFERMMADPQGVLERIARFIGLAGPVTWHTDAAKENASNQRLRASRWRDAIIDLPALVTLRRALVPRRVRDALKSPWLMKQRPELSPRTLARVTDVFDKDLMIFGQWLGHPLSCATFKDVAARTHACWNRAREVQHA